MVNRIMNYLSPEVGILGERDDKELAVKIEAKFAEMWRERIPEDFKRDVNPANKQILMKFFALGFMYSEDGK